MNILIITSRFPVPVNAGDKIRLMHIVQHLSQKHRITLFSLTDDNIPKEAIDQISQYVSECHIIKHSHFKSILGSLCGIFSAKPLQVHYYSSKAAAARLQEISQSQKFDVLICHLLRLAEYSKHVSAPIKILDLTDAISMNYKRLLDKGTRSFFLFKRWIQVFEYFKIRRYERQKTGAFDFNLLISAIDKKYLEKNGDLNKLHVVPAAVDANYFSFSNENHDSYNVIFVGKMSTVPNIDAIEFFIADIFPLVQAKVPDITLTIAGIEPGRLMSRFLDNPSVSVTGEVEDIRPYLWRAAVSICPMRLGAGSKNKILESMAVGTPVVSTTIGAEGLGLSRLAGVALCDTPNQFAAEIIRLLCDKSERQSRAISSRKAIEKWFNPQLSMQPLDDLLKME